MRWSVLDDFKPIESQQNIDQLIVVHLECRDDFLKFPGVHYQVGNDEDLRLIGKGDFLRLTQPCHESEVLGWLHQVMQRETDSGTDLIEPTKREVSDLPSWDRLFGTYRDTTEFTERCGFPQGAEGKLIRMLVFQDVYAEDEAPRSRQPRTPVVDPAPIA